MTTPLNTTKDVKRSKLEIASVDEPKLRLTAQYNPAEIVLEQPIAWTDHAAANNQTRTAAWTEFAGMKPRTMKIDLLFDGVENGGRLGSRSQHATPEKYVAEALAILAKLASVRDPSSKQAELRRPHFCLVAWAEMETQGMAPFRCVIDALSTKHSVFSPQGRILRATATLSLREADRVDQAKASRG